MSAPSRSISLQVPEAARRASSILYYGGTFDPPHRAHVELPALVRERLDLDLLLYVPASISPFKKGESVSPARHRLAMLQLAVSDQPRTAIWTVEMDEPGVHYTVDTLVRLRAQVGEKTRLYLLLGSDQAREFHRWREADRILVLCEPAIMMRPPDTRQSLTNTLAQHWETKEVERFLAAVVDVPLLDMEATDLRRRIRRGENVTGAMPEQVRWYIDAQGLYRA